MNIQIDNAHVDEGLIAELVAAELLKGDLAVVNSARVSFAKAHTRFDQESDARLIKYLARHVHWSPFAHAQVCFWINMYPMQLQDFALRRPMGLRITERGDCISEDQPHTHIISGSLYAFLTNMDLFTLDQRQDIASVLERRYPASYEALYNEPAGTTLTGAAAPMEEIDLVEEFYGDGDMRNVRHHATATMKFTTPIFVARQLVKHQRDLVWNEVSRRYVDDEPELWLPKKGWRLSADNVKQGSSKEILKGQPAVMIDLAAETGPGMPFPVELKITPEILNEISLALYGAMGEFNVCAEQKRMMLPQNMVTQWYWTGTLDAFGRVCKQRLDAHAQEETRDVVADLDEHLGSEWGEPWYAIAMEGADD